MKNTKIPLITQQMIADYLGVKQPTVSKYNKKKLYLMKKGLEKIMELRENGNNNT